MEHSLVAVLRMYWHSNGLQLALSSVEQVFDKLFQTFVEEPHIMGMWYCNAMKNRHRSYQWCGIGTSLKYVQKCNGPEVVKGGFCAATGTSPPNVVGKISQCSSTKMKQYDGSINQNNVIERG